jgi:hypothetical protein
MFLRPTNWQWLFNHDSIKKTKDSGKSRMDQIEFFYDCYIASVYCCRLP